MFILFGERVVRLVRLFRGLVALLMFWVRYCMWRLCGARWLGFRGSYVEFGRDLKRLFLWIFCVVWIYLFVIFLLINFPVS